MDEYNDLLQTARDGAKAHADGDSGRSAYLLEQVSTLLEDLTVAECEWLSIAVQNGAFNRQLRGSDYSTANVDVQQTSQGEIWDI